MIFYYKKYDTIKLSIYSSYKDMKLSNQLRIELKEELNRNRFQDPFILSLSLEKIISTTFPSPNV